MTRVFLALALIVALPPSMLRANDDPPAPIIDHQDDLCSLDPLCMGGGGGGGTQGCMNCATKDIPFNGKVAYCCNDNNGGCNWLRDQGYQVTTSRLRNCWVRVDGNSQQCMGQNNCN